MKSLSRSAFSCICECFHGLGMISYCVLKYNLFSYIGLVYSILYVWIESFNLVFVEMYGFNLGENGLSYLGLFVGAVSKFKYT